MFSFLLDPRFLAAVAAGIIGAVGTKLLDIDELIGGSQGLKFVVENVKKIQTFFSAAGPFGVFFAEGGVFFKFINALSGVFKVITKILFPITVVLALWEGAVEAFKEATERSGEFLEVLKAFFGGMLDFFSFGHSIKEV